MIKKFNQYNESFSKTEDEQSMARVHLQKIIENSQHILDNLEKMGDDIPAWVQDKISVTNHNMDAISTWIETNDEVNEKKKTTKGEKSKKGKHVPKKYLTKNKSAMKKEIDQYAGKDEYKTQWDAD